ncbi:MAG: SWIM zinc finger family protein [Chloroflexota bacterium]
MDTTLNTTSLTAAQKRQQRAVAGLANRQIKIAPFVQGRIWTVVSTMSGKAHEYTVTYGIRQDAWDGTLRPVHEHPFWECTCPDFARKGVPHECKHILAVKLRIGEVL